MRKMTKIAALIGSLMLSIVFTQSATADANPFADVDQVQTFVGDDKKKCGEGKCGDKKKEGKCGEGKCGDKKKAKKDGKGGEGKCGDKKKEGKCGEGKCGDKKKAKKEGKCGEGKCGGK